MANYGNPIWTGKTAGPKNKPGFTFNPIAGAFEINEKKAIAGKTFTPGYRPNRDIPLELDRPPVRFSRFRNTMNEGFDNYEFFGMKIKTPAPGTKATWFEAEAGSEGGVGVAIFGRNKFTNRSTHLGWVSKEGEELGLKGLLPHIENIPTTAGANTFPLGLSEGAYGRWFYKQKDVQASISAFARPEDYKPFKAVFKPPAITKAFLKKHWKIVAGVGAAALVGGYLLSRYGTKHEAMGAGPESKKKHHELTDFGSSRRSGNPTSTHIAMQMVTKSRYKQVSQHAVAYSASHNRPSNDGSQIAGYSVMRAESGKAHSLVNSQLKDISSHQGSPRDLAGHYLSAINMPGVGKTNFRVAEQIGAAGALVPSTMNAKSSGIRSQAARMSNLPNMGKRAGRPAKHANTTRAGV